MTGPEHYRKAEQLSEDAASVMDADYGMYSSMDTQERLQRRAALLADGQLHATLAAAAATADAARLPEHHPAWAAVHP